MKQVYDKNGTLLNLLQDTDFEHGINSNGEYWKFPNGMMICAKKVNVATTCDEPWGTALYTSPLIEFGNWPNNFADTPFISTIVETTDGSASIDGIYNASKTSAGSAYLYRPTVYTLEVRISITAIGRWK